MNCHWKLLARGLRYGCLLLILGTLSGCQVGRTWFHMDSNSPVPFFGFDLLPSRKTSMRDTDASPAKALVSSRREASVKPAESKAVRELHLPRISDLLKQEQTEELSFESTGRN